MFDSILPQGNQPNTPQLPANLLALIHGLPATTGIAQGLNAPPGGPIPPAPAPAPAGFAAGSPGPKPLVLPKVPAAPGLPLPDATAAGFAAGGAAAASQPAVNSTLGTLAGSLARGLIAGVPAFRAQRDANREAQYVQAVQAATKKSSDDFVNNDDNFSSFGVKGKNLQAALKGMDVESRNKLLQNNQLWAPPKISSFGKDGLYNETDGTVVKQPTGEPIAEGASVPLVDPATQKPRIGADGNPMFYTPNPKPVSTTYDKTSSEFKDYAIQVGVKEGATPTPDQAALINSLVFAAKQKIAKAGANQLPDLSGAEISKQALTDTSKRYAEVSSEANTLPALYDARHILATTQINAGAWGPIKQKWANLTGDASAASTQQVANDVMSTMITQLMGERGQNAGVSVRLTPTEVQQMLGAAGGSPTDQQKVSQHIIDARIAGAVEHGADHNAKLGAFARENPRGAATLASQYTVLIPKDPYAKDSSPPPAAGEMPKRVQNGITQVQHSDGKWYAPNPKDATAPWMPVGGE